MAEQVTLNISDSIPNKNAGIVDSEQVIKAVYNKPQVDARIAEVRLGNDLGVIKTTDEMPLTGIHFGKVFEAETYTNFKDASLASIVVTSADLAGNFVFIEVTNGVAKKVVAPFQTVTSTAKISTWTATTFTAGSQIINPFDGLVYEVKSGKTASGADKPHEKPLVWEVKTRIFADNYKGIEVKNINSLKGKNLFNKNNILVNFALQGDTGNSSSSANYYHSNYIEISDNKKYILSGFQAGTSINRVIVFYDINGVILSTSWGTNPFALANVDGSTYPIGRTFYILEPNATISPDWKTDGLATLPIPLGAKYVRFNTGLNIRDWTPFLMLEETTLNTPSVYESFGIKQSNIILSDVEMFKQKSINDSLFISNLYDNSKAVTNSYISYADPNAAIVSQAPISGDVFSVSDIIPIKGGNVYYLSGRTTNKTETFNNRGIRFFDALGNKIKPINSAGASYPTFSLPYLNGIVYTPTNAVSVQFTSMFYSLLVNSQEIQFTKTSNYLGQFLPFGNAVSRDLVALNKNVADGQVMIKQGDSFTGVSADGLGGSVDDYDGVYRIINYLATAILKPQFIEPEIVYTLPNNPIPTICYYGGNLGVVKDGVFKKIQLID